MNRIERVISSISPAWAARRARERQVLAYYEAARTTRKRKATRERGSGDAAVAYAGASLREQVRHLEQNSDLVRGALDVLVTNIVGPNGIGIEPTPRTPTGEIDTEAAKIISDGIEEWSERPEATKTMGFAAAQRIMCRTWLRDGEALTQLLLGTIRGFTHSSKIPFSIELIEPDYLPFESNSVDPDIVQGVERDSWGRPVAYHIYKSHPGDIRRKTGGTKRVTADRIVHLKQCDRIRQARGVSKFSSVITRLEDLKDYEESERVAAKIAASMAAYIRKGTPDSYEVTDDELREMKFRPGMIFDDLLPGEEIGTIDTHRPNAQLTAYRDGQLRAAACGLGITNSSFSKHYGGSYSSQRQELVEGDCLYKTVTDDFVGQWLTRVHKGIVDGMLLAGRLKNAPGLYDAVYVPPQMPWIDPLKEVMAWRKMESSGYASGPEIIRRRGRNPTVVQEQERRWREESEGMEYKYD